MRDFFSILSVLFAGAIVLMVMIPAIMLVLGVLYIIVSVVASL